jgi:tetratricopeptide (TPR) repeat protein
MASEPFIKICGSIFRPNELAVFCGAGISRGSGLPLANELKTYLVERLISDPADAKEILSATLPFELFLELVLVDESLYFKFLDLYEQGFPNPSHIFIAKLAKSKLVKLIITTNYDLLIEKAFSAEGMAENVDYKRLYRDDDFASLASQTIAESLGGKVGLIKIHGSAHDPESVRTVLMQVASRLRTPSLTNVFRDIFAVDGHKQLVVIGYSCSDIFDVTPLVHSFEADSDKAVLFVEHISKGNNGHLESEEDLQAKKLDEPFQYYAGRSLCCETDVLIKEIWVKQSNVFGVYPSTTPVFSWKQHIEKWYEDFAQNKALAFYAAGNLFESISNFDKAINYYKKALDYVKNDDHLRLNCSLRLGSTYVRQGHPREALPYYEKGLEIAQKQTKEHTALARCYLGMADSYDSIGESNQALLHLFDAIELERNCDSLNSYIIMTQASRSIGRILVSQGYQDLAEVFFHRSLDIAEGIGDVQVECFCRINLGTLFHLKGESTKAVEYLMNALKLAEQISDKALQSGCYTNLGIVYYDTKQWRNAERSIYKALKIAESTGDLTVELLCWVKLGDIYSGSSFVRRNPILAANLYYGALMLAEVADNNQVCAISSLGLARVYNSLRAYKFAIECSQKTVKHAQKMGNRRLESAGFEAMSKAFTGSGNTEKAEESLLKKTECLEQASNPHPLNAQIENIKALVPIRRQEKGSRS